MLRCSTLVVTAKSRKHRLHIDYTITVFMGEKRFCCGNFEPNNTYILKPNGLVKRILESGFCPHCNNLVVTLITKDNKGQVTFLTEKRKKAQRLFDTYKKDIIAEMLPGKVKYGNRSNMAFRYGVNEEKFEKGKLVTKQYAVDFNGTKSLVFVK